MKVGVGHQHIGIVIVANDVRFLGGTVLGDDFDMRLVAGPRRRGGRGLIVGGLDDVPIGMRVAKVLVAVRVVVADQHRLTVGRFGGRKDAGRDDVLGRWAVDVEVVVVWHVQVEWQWRIAIFG